MAMNWRFVKSLQGRESIIDWIYSGTKIMAEGAKTQFENNSDDR